MPYFKTTHSTVTVEVWLIGIVVLSSQRFAYLLSLSPPPPPPPHCSDRLSAQDLLSIRKVQEFAYQKVYGDEGKREGEGGEERKVDCGDCLEILCMDHVSVMMSQLSFVPGLRLSCTDSILISGSGS